MTHSYCIAPFKLAVSGLTSIVSFLMAGVQFYAKDWAGAVLFLIIALLFLAVAVINGSVITVDPSGIRKRFLSFSLGSLSWEEVAEVGVIGTRVFFRRPNRTGTRYIYFSPEPLDENKRFRLALEWPPRKGFYLQYTEKRLEAVHLLWTKEIETYNAGDTFH